MVSGSRAYSGLTASTGKGDHGRRDQEVVQGGDQDAEENQATDRAQDPGHAHPPTAVARILVGSSAPIAPLAGANTEAARMARRYPAIAAAGEPLW
jgi:hypothetical protein